MTRTSLIPKFIQILLLLLASPLLSKVSCIKECTNSPTQTELISHTVRAQLSADEVRALHEKSHSHLHLTPTDERTWINLMPRRLLHKSSDVEEFDWLMLYRYVKTQECNSQFWYQWILNSMSALSGIVPVKSFSHQNCAYRCHISKVLFVPVPKHLYWYQWILNSMSGLSGIVPVKSFSHQNCAYRCHISKIVSYQYQNT